MTLTEARHQLGLTTSDVADLVRLSGSTVYRLEAKPEAEGRCDPLTRSLLGAVRRVASRTDSGACGERLRDALLHGRGGLRPLYVLLGLWKETIDRPVLIDVQAQRGVGE